MKKSLLILITILMTSKMLEAQEMDTLKLDTF